MNDEDIVLPNKKAPKGLLGRGQRKIIGLG